MDTNRLIVLRTEVQAQLETINLVYQILVDRATHLQPASPIVLESVAYQLHNLYGAIAVISFLHNLGSQEIDV